MSPAKCSSVEADFIFRAYAQKCCHQGQSRPASGLYPLFRMKEQAPTRNVRKIYFGRHWGGEA